MIYSATKIIATLGPSSTSEITIKGLINAGVNIFRLNFSHGDFESHGRLINVIREMSSRLDVTVGIMQDLPGPKIRLGFLPAPVVLKPGEKIVLLSGAKATGSSVIPIQYPRFHRDVSSGDLVYIDDGAIRLRILQVSGDRVFCLVEIGGTLSSHKGVNLPGVKVSVPSLTRFDRKCLKFGIEQGVDFVAMSFVRRAGDIVLLRKIIKAYGGNQSIVAKIEKKEAVDSFDEILKKTDAVMIARGDLGIELPIYEVPVLQKNLISRCNMATIPVITATQVLESMTHNPRPTRAEASDAANAVIDGTDTLMLSGETAVGSFPIKTVETLKSICVETEKSLPAFTTKNRAISPDIAECIAHSVCSAAADLKIMVIATPTRTGRTAQLISRFRPRGRIMAFTESDSASKLLLLSRGVTSLPIDHKLPFAELVSRIHKQLIRDKQVRRGESIIITAGSPHSQAGETNLMMIENI